MIAKKYRAKHILNDSNPGLAFINRLNKPEKGLKFN